MGFASVETPIALTTSQETVNNALQGSSLRVMELVSHCLPTVLWETLKLEPAPNVFLAIKSQPLAALARRLSVFNFATFMTLVTQVYALFAKLATILPKMSVSRFRPFALIITP